MRPALRPLCVSVLLLGGGTLASAQEWYEHYLTARDRLIPQGRCVEAAKRLRSAIRQKPASALNEQTYGLQFVDYLPYYYLGLCQLRSGDAPGALESFAAEERRDAIRERPRLYEDLQLRTREARAAVLRAEQQGLARLARDRALGHLARSAELERERRYDQALEHLNLAAQAAEAADARLQGQVRDRISHVRGLKREAEQAAEATRKVESALAQARKALAEGRDKEAAAGFDDVLRLDPRNPEAEAGKREANERIRAATTRQERREALERGEALLAEGRYAEALEPLSLAAADPTDVRAREAKAEALRLQAGFNREREKRRRIERLMADGEALLASGRFAAAKVKFDEVLALDSTDLRAKERSEYAERRTEESVFEKMMPNRGPVLRVFEPAVSELEVDTPTLRLEGVTTDDRGLARLEFFLNGRLEAEQVESPRQASGEVRRELLFKREFLLAAGRNEIRVRATDSTGVQEEVSLLVARRLRFYEKPAFLPSAAVSALTLVALGLSAQRLRRRRALKRRFNPYVAGAPVVEEGLFFGRQRVLTRVLNLLHHNSFMITGERRIGKTSFLLRLRKALDEQREGEVRFFPALVDLSGVPEEEFFRVVMGDVVEALGPSPETLGRLRFSPGRGRYDGRDLGHDLQQILGELFKRTDRQVRLVLLMDEADVLNQYSERTNQLLRSTFMKTFSEHIVAVMCGVGVKRTWNSDGSPWYNFFEQIRLTPFAREDAEALIRGPVAGVFVYEPQAIESILEHSRMKPYLIQKFCIHAVNRMLDGDRTTVTALDVEAVREGVLHEAEQLQVSELGAPGIPGQRSVADYETDGFTTPSR